MYPNPVFMSPGALFISLSRAPFWAAGALRVPCSLPWIHDVFPCMPYSGLLRSLRCLFPCVLVVSCPPYLFLASFLYPEVHYLFPRTPYLWSVFSILIFPNSFFSISPSFLQGSEFLCVFPWISSAPLFPCYFDRFVSICLFHLFLWILICFSESEPLVFSSLAKTHKVVKLKCRPQWWQNAFVGYVKWKEALKHMHYLLAIIESSIFVRSLVPSLVVTHHWRRRFHLITYSSSASCCKAVRSSCFLFTLHGHTVKLEMASNFTRILTNENVSPNSTCHKLQKRQILSPNSKPKFDPKNDAIFGFA